MTKIVATSDFHGFLPEPGVIEPCDLLLIGGDICPVSDHSLMRQQTWLNSVFRRWLQQQLDEGVAKEIVGICGNHDFIGQTGVGRELLNDLPWHYLEDSSVELFGEVIHGSPYTPQFGDWAFMKTDDRLRKHWDAIPDNVTILVTHGPPYKSCDKVVRGNELVGSKTLRRRAFALKDMWLHVVGHIHEGYGEKPADHRVANVSRVDVRYEPTNSPAVFER